MTTLVVMTVVVIGLLIAGLAVYLYWVGTLLKRVADNLEAAGASVRTVIEHAKLIGPGVEHINRTGGVVAAALPLLYGFSEQVVVKVTPRPAAPEGGHVTRPASGQRRSRLLENVGYTPSD